MRFAVILVIAALTAAIPVSAQKRIATVNIGPPPIALFTPPKGEEFKEFSAPDGSFRVVFPGGPETSFDEARLGDAYRFDLNKSGWKETIVVGEFEVDMENDRVFDAFRPKSGTTSFEIVDIIVGGRKGREILADAGKSFERIRVVPVGNRIYDVRCAVANWDILKKSYPAKVSAFQTECDRFFKSFEILKFPPSDVLPNSSEFVGGLIDGIYENPYFGFRLKVPDGWGLLDDSEIKNGYAIGKRLYDSDPPSFRKILEESVEKDLIIFGIRNGATMSGSTANLLVSVQKLPRGTVSARTVMEDSLRFFAMSRSIEVGKPTAMRINGVRASVVDIVNTASGKDTKQRILIALRRGYSVTIAFTRISDEAAKELETMFASLEFK